MKSQNNEQQSTIFDLEAQIDNKNKTKKEKEKIKNERNEAYRLKKLYKATAEFLEENNNDKIIFFDSDNGYKKMGWNSALFYNEKIARRIGRRAKLDIDRDRYSHSETGTISFKFPNGFTPEFLKKLEAIQILKAKEQPYDGITIFELPIKISQAEIDAMKDNIQKFSQQINEIILPKIIFPTLCSDIRDLNLIVYQNTQNMQPFGRDILGGGLMKKCKIAMRTYCEMTNGDISEEEGLEKILYYTKLLIYEMKNMETLRLMHNRAIVRILELASVIKKTTIGELDSIKLSNEQNIKKIINEKEDVK